MNQQVEELLQDPDYTQDQLQDLFKEQFGDTWRFFWQRYLETGYIPEFYGDRS